MYLVHEAGRGLRLRALGLCVLVACACCPAFAQQLGTSLPPYAPLPPLLSTVDASRLHGDARELFTELKETEGDINRSSTPADRDRRLRELLFRSLEFVRFEPDSIQVWALRAVAATELNEADVAAMPPSSSPA